MEETRKVKQIALTLIEGLNSKGIYKLLETFKSEDEVFLQTPYSIATSLNCKLEVASLIVSNFEKALSAAEKEFLFNERNSIKSIFFTDEDYPERLLLCNDAPPIIYVKGDCNLNSSKMVAVVGTRRASEHGKRLCRKFIEDLASFDDNIVIVSGLAFGVDITAHSAALDCGLPTIGVIAGGFNNLYPVDHISYVRKMVSTNGAVITEHTKDIVSLPFNFVSRNRIIAGLCDATVVVESSIKGGSLLTAKYALSYNRDIYAFPGRVGERLSEGCNNIIKYNKAGMIENADDFLYFMGWNINGKGKNVALDYSNLEGDEMSIYKFIESEKTVHYDSIILKLSDIKEIDRVLLEMELKGIIEHLPGNFYTLF